MNQRHIQDDFEGTSIHKWELDHGIVRYVKGGCEYVVCMDWDEFQRKAEDERQRARREFIAEQQEAAYFGR